MKPERNTCLYCNKVISNKAKFCSDAHRKAYARNPDNKSDKPKSDTDNSQVGHNPDIRESLTRTDQTFYDRNDGPDGIIGKDYYNFGSELRESKCLHCGAGFKTHMAMLKFCSYDHYKKAFNI